MASVAVSNASLTIRPFGRRILRIARSIGEWRRCSSSEYIPVRIVVAPRPRRASRERLGRPISHSLLGSRGESTWVASIALPRLGEHRFHGETGNSLEVLDVSGDEAEPVAKRGRPNEQVHFVRQLA